MDFVPFFLERIFFKMFEVHDLCLFPEICDLVISLYEVLSSSWDA